MPRSGSDGTITVILLATAALVALLIVSSKGSAAIPCGGVQGDDVTSIVYHSVTGEISFDAPAGRELTSINIDSASGIFTSHEDAENLDGSFDTHSEHNIFKATFGSSFGSLSFGPVATPGLNHRSVADDLTVMGSLAGGGGLGEADLICLPEPSTFVLTVLGLLTIIACERRKRQR